MKAKILTLLRERADYVSGQELCERFGVSRTAVWKAVGQLKKEGYLIEAVPSRGYLLVEDAKTEVYGQREIESRLQTAWAGRCVSYYEETDSTNARAKLAAESGAAHGTLFVAYTQTAGRGRRGKSWSSPAGKNLYFTLLLRPEIAPDRASMLTLVMAMAVAKGIEELSGAGEGAFGSQIKWPNDIVMDGKKVCGILTEMSLSVESGSIQYVVIGTGINVDRQEFPPEISATADCLERLCGEKLSKSRLLAAVLEAFEEYYRLFMETGDLSELMQAYNERLVNCGRQVRVLDPKGEYEGISEGITRTGELIVTCPGGERRTVYAGEVSVRGVYGYV